MSVTGALLKKSVDQTAADYSSQPAVAWDEELYDSHGFHAGGDDFFTVPASMDGEYAVFHAQASLEQVTVGSDNRLLIQRDTGGGFANFNGMGHMHNKVGTGQSATQTWLQCCTAPLLLVTGHKYRTNLYSDDTSVTVEAARSTFGIRVLNRRTTQRVLAKLNADLTAQNFTTAGVIGFDGADVYDTDSIHSPTVQNSKLIAPSSLNGKWAVIRAAVMTGVDNGGLISLAIRKNGSLSYNGFGGKAVESNTLTTSWVSVFTQPIQLVTGDEFEALFWNGTDTSITISSSATCLGLQVVD